MKLHSSLSLALLVTSASFITPSHQLKLPSYIKTCKQNDPKLNECVVKHGRIAIPKFINGDVKYRVPKLDPLEISELRVHQGSKALGLTLALKNCKVTGLKHAQFLTARKVRSTDKNGRMRYNRWLPLSTGVDMALQPNNKRYLQMFAFHDTCRTDLKNKHIEWDIFHPAITIVGTYEMSGQVLVLPIRGRGLSNITLTNMKTIFKFDFELEKREDGQEYMKVTKTHLEPDIGRAYFRFTNLFNGDRLLGETMNRFLNDNWKEVVQELGAPVVDSISQVFEIILSRITELVPYNLVYPPS